MSFVQRLGFRWNEGEDEDEGHGGMTVKVEVSNEFTLTLTLNIGIDHTSKAARQVVSMNWKQLHTSHLRNTYDTKNSGFDDAIGTMVVSESMLLLNCRNSLSYSSMVVKS